MKRLLALLALLALLMVPAAPALAADTPAQAVPAALGWLLTRQQADGSFAGFDAGASADAIFAIVAVGSDPNGVLKNGSSPVSYLGTQAASYATKSTAAAGKLALAVVAAGKDPRAFGGQNLLGLINAAYNPASGQYGADITGHAYALLALASAGQPIPAQALAALGAAQLPDGGWSFDGTAATGSDTNTAALAVQALVAAGAKGDTLARGLAYLQSQQNADGGFPYSKSSSFGADTDANSTAVVIQALAAAGGDTAAPLAALLKLQNPSGAFGYQAALPDDNDLATAQAIPALLLKPFPLKTVSLPAEPAQPASAQPAPARLPNTGGAQGVAWIVLAALSLLAAGAILRLRRAF